MSKKLLPWLFAVLAGVLILPAKSSTAEEIPDEIKIYNEGYRTKLYQPVEFPHRAHAEDYGIECTQCHHNYKDGKNVWQEGDPVRKCIVCHNPVKKQGTVPRLVFAYHFNCRNCHKENESGPIECSDCHTKK